MKRNLLLTILIMQIFSRNVTMKQCTCTQLKTQNDCETMLNQLCSWNSNSKKCEERTSVNSSYCDTLKVNSCLKFNQCSLINGKCTIFTGCSAFLKTSYQDCQEISHRCTTNGVQCIELGECSTYTSQISCYINTRLKFLNNCLNTQYTQICGDADTCYKLPIIFDTDLQCRMSVSNCTTTGFGCVLSGENCNDQLSELQCQWNRDKSIQCYWNGQSCVDKSCENASKSFNNDQQCSEFNNAGLCIANKDGGCFSPKTCTEQNESTCIIDQNKNPCYWDGSICTELLCQQAPQNFHTNEQCSQFMENCITNGSGCVKSALCAEILTKDGCIYDKNGNNCIWFVTCKEKTCENSPEFNNSLELCTAYIGTCTVNSTKNGCINRTCQNAPETFQTNSQCEVYLPNNNCIMKKDGGCTINTTCSAIDIQDGCVIDATGKQCIWNNESSICRDKICDDYQGKSYKECQLIGQNCILGQNGQCITITQCSNILNQESCLFGTDGPCLWITRYKNEDNTFGACFKFTSCESIPWQTNDQCNLISNKCTTNGMNCVSITFCNQTNVNGGCINGIDGPCMQITDINGKVSCQYFTMCQTQFLTTHKECQKINKKCISNGVNCEELKDCSSYTKVGCYKSSKGQIITNGQIKSTGYCVWDQEICRDQNCQDLYGSTDEICSGQLSKCTSYNGQCLEKKLCKDYEGICPSTGIDGVCIFNRSCRLKQCSDIKTSNNTNSCGRELSKCISDGVQCIEKMNCSAYLTEIPCLQGGTDGVCIYDEMKMICQNMQHCSDAYNNPQACQKASDRCVLKDSACLQISCYNQYEILKVCTFYYDWTYSSIVFCKLENDNCFEIYPENLEDSNCLIDSQYSYSWKEQKCQSCFAEKEMEKQLTFNIVESLDCSQSKSCLTPTISVSSQTNSLRLVITILSIYIV